ncbi:hypothetical protein [Halomonas sp. H5]
MQLQDLETGGLVADPVPEDAPHQAGEVLTQAGWAEDPAGREIADP